MFETLNLEFKEPSLKVNFFATCLGATIYSNASLNAIKLLRKENLEVVFKKTGHVAAGQATTQDTMKRLKKSFYTISNFIPITTTYYLT